MAQLFSLKPLMMGFRHFCEQATLRKMSAIHRPTLPSRKHWSCFELKIDSLVEGGNLTWMFAITKQPPPKKICLIYLPQLINALNTICDWLSRHVSNHQLKTQPCLVNSVQLYHLDVRSGHHGLTTGKFHRQIYRLPVQSLVSLQDWQGHIIQLQLKKSGSKQHGRKRSNYGKCSSKSRLFIDTKNSDVSYRIISSSDVTPWLGTPG